MVQVNKLAIIAEECCTHYKVLKMCIISYMYKLLIHNFMILEHVLHENSLTNIQSCTSLNLTFSLFICHWANRLKNYGHTEEREERDIQQCSTS